MPGGWLCSSWWRWPSGFPPRRPRRITAGARPTACSPNCPRAQLSATFGRTPTRHRRSSQNASRLPSNSPRRDRWRRCGPASRDAFWPAWACAQPRRPGAAAERGVHHRLRPKRGAGRDERLPRPCRPQGQLHGAAPLDQRRSVTQQRGPPAPGPGEGTGHRVRWRPGGQGGAGLLALHGRPELRSGLPPQWHRRLQERPRNARGLPGWDRGLVLAVA
jgi:hypothetical protein